MSNPEKGKIGTVVFFVLCSFAILVVGFFTKKSTPRIALIGSGGFLLVSFISIWAFNERCNFSDFRFYNCSSTTLEYFAGFASFLALLAPLVLVLVSVATPLIWFISIFRD